MKRKAEPVAVLAKKPFSRPVPPSWLEGVRVPAWVLALVAHAGTPHTMEVDSLHELKFLVFLDAQGKEFMDVIRGMFPAHFDSLTFVLSNISPRYTADPHFRCATLEACKELAAFFNILDPLGGGLYPLNYLIVTDEALVVRCKLPIRVSRFCAPHQRFGVSLLELQGLVDAYLDFVARLAVV